MKQQKTLALMAAVCLCLCSHIIHAQQTTLWSKASEPPTAKQLPAGRVLPSTHEVFTLDMAGLRQALTSAPIRSRTTSSNLIISFPTPTGELQQFRVQEASLLPPALLAKYPGINSYVGQGIDDPSAIIRFSVSHEKGFHGMVLSGSQGMWYIDPYTNDLATYKVYHRKSLNAQERQMICYTDAQLKPEDRLRLENQQAKTNDQTFRTYRLALSCNAEYGNLFAGTGTDAEKTANILAQMNVTMTRVNGVYERDFAITMELVPNNDDIIYFGSTSSDPWNGEYNSTTQTVIDNVIGNANYDIGHNFNTSGGGNAGYIACVCTTGEKGSGYTGRANPTGDAFDIDYVAHEMGHQFGGYHTQASANCISGDGYLTGSGTTEVEPGSASTIMGYAGICPPNVQSNSDAYFHYVNIRDISANVQSGVSSACAVETAIINTPPTANAGPDYTIPKSTAFVLHGEATDADGDALTYCWEQNDPQPYSSANTATPSPTQTVGPLFRSLEGTTSPDRYMPSLSSVIAGNLTPTWEVVPSVGRTLNFALTVRDNHAGGGQTNDDLMAITVSGSAGPFVVSSPNTAVLWAVGSSQNVLWDVAGTSSAPVSCATVNILLSLDGGLTYPVTLASATANDGTEIITVPNNLSTTCRIKVEAADNIFYDISNADFTISESVNCTAAVPTGFTASSITTTSATLTWDVIAGATYDVRYRESGTTTWTDLSALSSNSVTLTGLTLDTEYEAQVRSTCSEGSSDYTSSLIFTTLSVTYCTSMGEDTDDEYLQSVVLNTINNVSGDNGGYADYTSLSTDLTLEDTYSITLTPHWTGTIYSEAYRVWIDYNQDGDFTDSDETVYSRSATTATSVTGSLTVPASALTGSTRMRVSMRYNTLPTPCQTFTYGEVEDYTVNIVSGSSGPEEGTCENVTLTLTFDNYPEETSWQITDSGSTVVASGGPYGSQADGSTLPVVTCLEAGCYTLTVLDGYGDGMCCSFGNGSYTLTDESSTVIASGGDFSSSASHNFCVGSASTLARGDLPASVEQPARTLAYPNPVRKTLYLSIPEKVTVHQIAITTTDGLTIQVVDKDSRAINVAPLRSGLYILSVETQKGMIHEKFIKE